MISLYILADDPSVMGRVVHSYPACFLRKILEGTCAAVTPSGLAPVLLATLNDLSTTTAHHRPVGDVTTLIKCCVI